MQSYLNDDDQHFQESHPTNATNLKHRHSRMSSKRNSNKSPNKSLTKVESAKYWLQNNLNVANSFVLVIVITSNFLGVLLKLITSIPAMVNAIFFGVFNKLNSIVYFGILIVAAILGSLTLSIVTHEMKDYSNPEEMIIDKEWEQYIQIYKQETEHDSFKAKVYTGIPWRFMSRVWGAVHKKTIPKMLRKPFFSSFIYLTGVNMTETPNQNLKTYKNLNSFFRREIIPSVRPISSPENSDIISPVDGRILSYGKLKDNSETEILVKQVKGISYSLKSLLGPATNSKVDSKNLKFAKMSEIQYKHSLMKDPKNNDLFYSVIYLAPGDYHRFHSPTEWKISNRRHFPGDLYSVNPKVAGWLKNLFALNERVVLNGEWKHGFFSYSAVGACLVGSMKIYFDEKIMTSKPYSECKAHKHNGIYFDKTYDQKIKLNRGDPIGEFNIGSTVILIFEAPKNFEFSISDNQKLFLGESIQKI